MHGATTAVACLPIVLSLEALVCLIVRPWYTLAPRANISCSMRCDFPRILLSSSQPACCKFEALQLYLHMYIAYILTLAITY